MRIGTAQDARNADSSVIAEAGVPSGILMENAALAARSLIRQKWGIAGKTVLVLCGTGNNGGDGFALARLLHADEALVTAAVCGNPDNIKEPASGNYNSVLALNLPVIQSEPELENLDMSRFDVIVDGLLGTGLSRPVNSFFSRIMEKINSLEVPVLSLDIPSGVCSDTGAVLGCALNASATVAFGIPKRGNILYPGYDLNGELYVSRISFPPDVVNNPDIGLTVNRPPALPLRNPAGHKGTFGKILIVGGSPNYAGAPALAGMAALRSGAGYVRLAVPADLTASILPLVPEAVFCPMEGPTLGLKHLADIKTAAESSDAVVLGPGLSLEPESIRLAQKIIAETEGPLVIDADALRALPGCEELILNRSAPVVLTPHSGEMARLLETTAENVNSNRVEAAEKAAGRFGAAVVLKGAHTLIAHPEKTTCINLTGNSGMATAGSGDVLSGILGALSAANLPFWDAVCLGVHLHGLSGDLAAEDIGEVSLTARTIADCIHRALGEYSGRLAADSYSGKIRMI